MLRGRLFSLMATALIAVPLAGQTPDPFESKVRGLSHPRYVEREKAARDLEAAGEPALKALKAAQASTDAELRARAGVIVEKIERVARSKRLLVAPTLTLKFDKVPLDQAVNQLASKTGLQFMVDGTKIKDTKRAVTLDTGKAPFWEAVHAFYIAAGLTEDDSPAKPDQNERYSMSTGGRRLVIRGMGTQPSGGERIRLIDGTNPPVATSQAFRVRALPADFAQNKYEDQKDEVTFHLDVDPAPGTSVQEIVGIEVRKAVTDGRRALAPAYPAHPGNPAFFGDEVMLVKQMVVLNGDMMLSDFSNPGGGAFPVTLKAGGSRPKQLAELHGVVVARVMAPPEPLITVADVFGKGKGQTSRADGLSCEVTSAKPDVESFVKPPRLVARGQAPSPVVATAGSQAAAVSVKLVSNGDATSDMLNLPVQIKGKLQPFIRINRLRGTSAVNVPAFEVRDADGKLLRVLSTRQTASQFDGETMTQEIELTFEKPAKGLDGVSLTVTARRPAVVEMPFVLKDVPLP